MEFLNTAYCIRCGAKIPRNFERPYCPTCSGSCSANNRFSSTEGGTPYCHLCGEPVFVEERNPVCPECHRREENRVNKAKK